MVLDLLVRNGFIIASEDDEVFDPRKKEVTVGTRWMMHPAVREELEKFYRRDGREMRTSVHECSYRQYYQNLFTAALGLEDVRSKIRTFRTENVNIMHGMSLPGSKYISANIDILEEIGRAHV